MISIQFALRSNLNLLNQLLSKDFKKKIILNH
jgi:hypothetical protein